MIQADTNNKKARVFLLNAIPDHQMESVFIAEVIAEGHIRLLDTDPAWLKLMRRCSESHPGQDPDECEVDKASHDFFQQIAKYLQKTTSAHCRQGFLST
jgi:hypothetical protein